MTEVNVLIVGKDSWKDKYNIPQYIHINQSNEIVGKKISAPDVVILDRNIIREELEQLLEVTKSYCLFVTENASVDSVTRELLQRKMGKRLYTGDLNEFFNQDVQFFYPNPYGEKFNSNFLQVNQLFDGEVVYKGRYNLELTGSFGKDFRQIAYWKNNIPISKGQTLDLYFEHAKTDDVQVKLRIVMFGSGSVDTIENEWIFDDEQLKDVVRIKNDKAEGMIYASVLAKGEGKLNIYSLHDRYSRDDWGYFLPGGKRYTTTAGEEIFAYFEPGDFKPPLCFYFSGFKTQEGFEGYYMMKKMGCPFVLIAEARLEGGAFYIGDSEYEELMVSIIKKYMKRMRVKADGVIFSGASMGTVASLYYGCDIRPNTLILAKPLVNLGNVARNETLVRVGTFSNSLEVVLKNYGNLSDKSLDLLNQRFWDKFDKADWSKTKFIIAYLYEDDYDTSAYADILSHINSEGVQVYGKGIHGRHTDNTAAVFEWFKQHYAKVLREDFGR